MTVPGLTNAEVNYINSSTPLILVSTPTDVLSDSISISGVLKTLVWNGLLSAQDYIGCADFGSEVSGGTGGLDINNLSYTWTANSSVVLAVGNNTYVVNSMGGNNITGNGAVDTVVYASSYSNYQIKSSGSQALITEANNIATMDVLQGISYIQFSNGTYNIATGSFAPLTAAGPTLSSLVESPLSGDLDAGKTVTFTLTLSEAVTVASGTPTLTLNDGGTATYTGGTGTSALTFSYTVAAGQNTSSLAATAVNLNSATITDGAGNAANLSLSGLTQSGPQIDTVTPTITSLAESPSSSDLSTGKTVTLNLNLSEAVTVAGGTPTLTLNDGGTATYTGGSGTSALTFSYTVGAGQNTSSLAATAVNLNSATITDGAGNAANLSLSGLTQNGPQVDTVTPTITSLAESPANGDLNAGKVVTITLGMSELVTVNTTGGTPTLSLNDGGTATYTGGSGSNALTFSYTVGAGQNTPDLMETAVNLNGATIQDSAGNAANLSLTGLPQGSPQIDTTAPTITSLMESPASGDLNAGNTVTLTLNLSEGVTVVGGTPTLTLNDGGTAIYTGGSGTSALTFSYTVGAGQNTSDLTATAVNLNSATIADGAGNAANLSLSGLTQSGPQIDTTTPAISSLVESPASGDLNAGKTVTLTLNLSEAVTVAGGTPRLTLNAGGTGTYNGGSGPNALSYSYTVGAGQNTSALAATAFNLNSATISDGAGNAANLSLSGLTQSGPQIDTVTPTITSLAESPSSGDLNAGKTVTIMLNLNESVTVAGGTPTLTLNDGGIATYAAGSGTNALSFSYTVGAGQNTSALAATAVNPNSATISDGAGNAANLSLSGLTQSGPQIDTTATTITSLMESPASGDLNAGKTVTFTLDLNETVTVAGGTPTLTLNDGGTATYSGGSGTNALTFSYTVGAGQNTSALAATAFNLNSATISGAGNAANLSLSGLTQSGPQIDTVTPTITSLAELPSSGDLNVGKTVTFTLNLNEAVTVAGGTPTLTLNDGGTATYSGGSGTNALTFSYTVGAGQNTAALAATAVNLNSATITDGAGNAANLSLSGLTQSGPQIDTITPTITSLAESPSSGDLNAGKAVTITLGMSELVTVNTTGGTPTLSLNDGGTAGYTGGSGTNALTFSYTVLQGQNTPDLMETAVNLSGATIADGAGNIANLSLAGVPQGSPQIDTTTPSITSLTESPASGDLNAGKTVTLTLNQSEAVTVAGGTPTLTLNDGGTATYSGGSGSNALTFSYTVGAGQNTAALAATAVNLNSATVTDGAGNAANLALSGLTQSGPQIDALTPTVSSLVESPASGELNAGNTVTLTLNLSEAVTVAGGTPTLTLNNGGTTTYTGGSGTSALTFSYTVGAGQNTFALAATAVNLNSATITDGAGNAANLSLSGLTQSGPQIDALSLNALTPTVSSLVESPASGDLNAGKTVTLTLNLSEAVTVAGGMPTLTLNDGGTATYSGGFGTNALTFSYTVGAGQNTAALAATAVNLNSATITDGAGNAANLSLSGLTQSGPQIDTTTPTAPVISSFTPNGGTAFGSYTDAHVLTLTGSALANTTVEVFDGSALLGTASVNGSGAWSYTTRSLGNGSQSFTAQDVDAAGNVSAASAAWSITIVTAAKLSEINNHYFVNTTTSDPEVQYAGSPVVAGQFGAWTPIGTVQTASGYDVAWKNTATGQYTVWTTDSNGNYTGNLTGSAAVSGTSYALESIEPVFQQDLNGDGHIGPTATVIQTDGSTSLTEIANQFCLNNPNGSGPALRYLGNVVTVGEFGAWTPIGAIQTGSGYDVAWKNSASGQYTVWTTDSNGNYTGNLTGAAVSGTSYALESIEPVFQQDLNGDGHIGPTATVIQTDGSTSLTEIANQFCLNNPNGSGPALRYLGNVVTVGEFGAWTPIGAVQTASGYDVAWKDTATNQYTVWTTDSNGNYTGNNTGTVSGTNTVLESLESVFGQDLNGDRVVGIYAASGTTLQITSALAGTSGAATIGAGATLGLAAADSASVTFTSSTGMLLLDHSSTFSGTIFKFTGTGALSGSDQIDLKDIKYSSVHDSYANGVLTVTDGSGDAAKLTFNGSYTLANFKFASDGSSGTIVYDPPVTPSSGQNTVAPFGPSAVIGMDKTLESMDLPGIAFNAQSTLGDLPNSNQAGGIPSVAEGIGNANIALLGNYMASMFAVASDNHGAITTLAEVAQHNDQSLLSNPHHA